MSKTVLNYAKKPKDEGMWSLQLCLTLCDPMNWSLPGSSVHGVFQAVILDRLSCPPPGDLPNPRVDIFFIAVSETVTIYKPYLQTT